MTPARPTRSARYHARRKADLHERLDDACWSCGTTTGVLEVDHVWNDGDARRAENGTAGEITRLLGLAIEVLRQQVQLLCVECHRAKTLARYAA